MGFFSRQLANVVEWEEWSENTIFWKWTNREIKKGSKLIIRPGQDAIFLNNGKIEGIFKEDGEYDIESEIIPFLSTLKGFKFGFNSGMRAEVLFVNTKEFMIKWGTRNPINIPTPSLPGGMPIRANGTLTFKVNDYITLIDKIAGTKDVYNVENVKERITSVLDQLLMKWITREGKDMFNLQANAYDISKGIQQDLNGEILNNGLAITGFNVMSFNYPEEVQKMLEKSASHSMIGNLNTYTQVSMVDAMASGKMPSGGGTASDMTGMMMGMKMAEQMMNSMNNSGAFNNNMNNGNFGNNNMSNMGYNNASASNMTKSSSDGTKPNFCPNCGTKTTGANFCSNCGYKL